MSFNEYKKLDLISISEDVLAFWEKKSIFNKSISNRKKK